MGHRRGFVVLAALLLGGCASTGPPGESAAPATSPLIAATTVPVTGAPATAVPEPAAVPVFGFALPESIDGWRTQNDPVMGGRSSSAVTWADAALVFEGDLSLANGGGFVSVVSPSLVDPAWKWADAVTVEASGDGRTYVLQLRTTGTGNWVQQFPTTAGAPTTAILSWAAFVPVNRFLDPVPAPGPLDPATVASVAVYLLDGQEGPFRLAVRAIG